MKVLLLHPDDDPLAGRWVSESWDLVYDLGRSGWPACERWSKIFGCPVKPVDGLRSGLDEAGRVRELLRAGLGRLVDREGLDWWELTAILIHHQLEALVLLRKLANRVSGDAEVWLTRGGFEADALRQVLGGRVHVFAAGGRSGKGPLHFLDRLRQLPWSQVVQIVGDKYDWDYKVRRHFHARPARSRRPVVLAPSSYVNMSLTAVAYAGLAPEHEFLLLPTRSSGWLREIPANVKQAWLASYAADFDRDELRELVNRWEKLRVDLESVPELAAAAGLGLMDDFPSRFAYGLALRDAWVRVLELELVEAVLCCDDSNPATHLPMLLGRRRGLPAISSHHGALDGRYLMKTCHADVLLAKGAMEVDYLVETCGVDPSVVEVGASSAVETLNERREAGDWIVFFSEPYEMTAGRTEEIYRDVLPGLGDLAKRTGKTLVVKVHPSENLKDRQSLAAKIFPRDLCSAIRWCTGSMSADLFRRAWFGVTVLSSVAVECAARGLPCFMCDWLDLWPYGYVTQYRKFGIALGLQAPKDIAGIPERVAEYRPNVQVAENCCEAIAPERLREILAGRKARAHAPLGMQRMP